MRILVTGADGRIGSAIVTAALSRGHTILAHEFTADLLARYHGDRRVMTIDGDLRQSSGLWALESRARAAGIDAAIAAHKVRAGSITEVSAERVRATSAVKTASFLWVFTAVAETLGRERGKFIAVLSQPMGCHHDDAVSCAASWATHEWLDGRARVEGPAGIRIRALCPGAWLIPRSPDATTEFGRACAGSAGEGAAPDRTTSPCAQSADPSEIAIAALDLAEHDHPLAIGAYGRSGAARRSRACDGPDSPHPPERVPPRGPLSGTASQTDSRTNEQLYTLPRNLTPVVSTERNRRTH